MDKSIGTSTIITGAPGSGKSFVSSLFTGAINLDSYGEVIDDKGHKQWRVNTKLLPKGKAVYEGICDNIQEVVKYLNPDIIYFVVSDAATNRRVSQRRYDSGEAPEFKDAWLDRTKWSEAEFDNYQKSTLRQVTSVANCPVLLIDNRPSSRRYFGLSVKWNTHPWHRFKK